MNYAPSLKVKAAALLELRRRAAQSRPVALTDLHIMTKQRRIEKLKPNRIQRHLLDNLTGRDLVLKSRQVGASTVIEADNFCAALNGTERIAVIAHDDDTTQKMRDMQQLFFDELADHLKPERTRNSATRAYYPRTKSQVYIATAGNRTAGRGGTYSRIHGSEVAFWSNAAQIVAGMMQGVPPDGRVVFESTANGAQGWFYLEVMAALRGESEIKVHFYPWWWDETAFIPLTEHEQIEYTNEELKLVTAHQLRPDQIKWRRSKQRELRELFQQEYPESIETAFLVSGDNVFGDVKSYLYEPTETQPIKGHRHVAALDWGQANDYTALSIMDATANREVFLGRWRHQDYQTMRYEVLNACAFWGVEVLSAESNSASSNIEELDREIDERRMSIHLESFVMSNKLKADMVSVFKTGLQDVGLRLLDPADGQGNRFATAEMQQWQTKQTSSGLWQYTHPDGGHDDTIIARIRAWFIANMDFNLSFADASDDFTNMWLGR